MSADNHLTSSTMTASIATTIAGIIFSLLLISSLVLTQPSVHTNPLDTGDLLTRSWTAFPGLALASYLLLPEGIFLGAALIFMTFFLLISVHILRENLPQQKVEV